MDRLDVYKKFLSKMDIKENTNKPNSFKKPDINIKVTQNNVLMKFLLENVKGKKRDNFKTLLKDGQVSVDGEIITWFNHPLVVGQEVRISSEKALKTTYPGINIIFEDQFLIVVEKNWDTIYFNRKRKRSYSIQHSGQAREGARSCQQNICGSSAR